MKVSFTTTEYQGGVDTVNTSPVIHGQTLTISQGDDLSITLGDLLDADGDMLTYTVSGTSNIRPGLTTNTVIFNSPSVGQETLTVSVDDGNGGISAASIVISITSEIIDGTAPVVTSPTDLLIEFASGGTGLAHSELTTWLASASALDAQDGQLSVANNLASLPNPLPAASHTITFSAMDAAGNIGSDSALVVVSEALSPIEPSAYDNNLSLPVDMNSFDTTLTLAGVTVQ